ncbi:MAG: MFS transporter [Clostridiales bacterium]|nr:MFS transporter [Clostridiales bacterium]
MGDKRTYTKKEAGMYLTGMFGQNMIYNIIATGLVSFYLQYVLYIPVTAIGVILVIARVWDAINDPIMGSIVDRTKSKWGKCRPYLIYAPIPIGLITILTFVNGIYTNATTGAGRVMIVIWAGVSYILWGMVYTVGDVPIWGITSLMSEDQDQRSKILGLARVVAGVGGIGVLVVQIGQALGSVFTDGLTAGTPEYNVAVQKGFLIGVVVLTVISTICFQMAGIGTKERIKTSEERHTITESFKIMWKCKPFRQILISGILRSPIQLMMLLAMSFATYYFCNGDFMNLFGDNGINIKMLVSVAFVACGIFLGQFISMALAPVFAKKIENKTLYNIYSIGGGVAFLMLYVIYRIFDGDVTGYVGSALTGVMFFFASAGFGGVNVMQSVMIADCVDYEEYNNGIRPDGIFFSGQSFITKLSGGIAAIIQSAVYGYIGFSDKAIEIMNADLVNGASFITYNGGSYANAMFILLSVFPAVGMFLAVIPTAKYALSDKEHKRMLNELIAKRTKESAENPDDIQEA